MMQRIDGSARFLCRDFLLSIFHRLAAGFSDYFRVVFVDTQFLCVVEWATTDASNRSHKRSLQVESNLCMGYRRFWKKALLVVVLQFPFSAMADLSKKSQETATEEHGMLFETDVVPILRVYCWRCHGLEGRIAELDLRRMPLIHEGGLSGSIVVPGSSQKSLLYRVLFPGDRQEAHERAMQQVEQQGRQGIPGLGIRPSAQHVKTIGAWIDAGAHAMVTDMALAPKQSPPVTRDDRQWWSFQSPVRPAVPRINPSDQVRSPIDAFLLAKLQRHGLSLNQEAVSAVLVRRLHLDLLGLPPSRDRVDRYLHDPSPDRYERLIDRLLASPRYGERWGRHWLDAAGYVDVMGHDDLITSTWLLKGIWRYRDYVIRSYNEDKPFDRFLLEQIAGDELVAWREAEIFTPHIRDHLVATGFLRLARDQTYEQVSDTAVHRYNTLVEMLTSFGTNVLGLTVQCAQCHTHKYEPISQLDYYRLGSLFTPAYDPQNWRHSWGDKVEREVPLEDPESGRFLRVVSGKQYGKIELANADLEARIKPLRNAVAEIQAEARAEILAEKIELVPEDLRADVQAAIETPEKDRSDAQQDTVKKFGSLLGITEEEVAVQLGKKRTQRVQNVELQIRVFEDRRQRPELIQALWDVGPPSPQYILERGDFKRPGFRVTPGVLSVLDDPENPFVVPFPRHDAASSGYRTALARWLGRDDHPLTARVFVNRVWQRYFERGIVETTGNFGRSGSLPSHPELLDWLATEFVRGGWKLKHLQRRILTATAYRQATTRTRGAGSVDPQEVDPQNRLLWKMPLRRLDSEVIRDSILAISGKLEPTMGGPPVFPLANDDGATLSFQSHPRVLPVDEFRRAVYVVARRNYHLNLLKVFDQPMIAINCTQRNKSAVVLQSLTLLNDRFIQEQAVYFSGRVIRLAGSSQVARIQLAFQLALGREPNSAELSASNELLGRQKSIYRKAASKHEPSQEADQALGDLCHMLLNTSEFLYIR